MTRKFNGELAAETDVQVPSSPGLGDRAVDYMCTPDLLGVNTLN